MTSSAAEPADGLGWATECFLGVLPGEALDEMVDRATAQQVAAGQYLYEPELAIVELGVVRAYVTDSGGRQLTVSYVNRGGAVGLMHLIGRSYPVGFQAVTTTKLERIDRTLLHELMGHHPQLGWAAAAEVTRRVDEMLAEVTRVAFGSLNQRMAHHLLALTEGSAPGGEPVAVRQADLALAVGVARETATRVVSRLVAERLVTTGPGGVRVVNRDGLRAIEQVRI